MEVFEAQQGTGKNEHVRKRRGASGGGGSSGVVNPNTWEIIDFTKGVVAKLKMPPSLKISPSGTRTWVPYKDDKPLTKLEKKLKLSKVDMI